MFDIFMIKRISVKASFFLFYAVMSSNVCATAESKRNEAINEKENTEDVSLQSKKRKYLRYLSESIDKNSGESSILALTVPELLDYAQTAYMLKDFEKVIALTRQVADTLMNRGEKSSVEMKNTLLLSYKAKFLLKFKSKSMHDIRPDAEINIGFFNSLLKYSTLHFESNTHNQLIESIALFIYELPLSSGKDALNLSNMHRRDIRVKYTKLAVIHTLNGKYKTSNSSLQKLDFTTEYNFVEPVKAYYYLGRNALIKHRFNHAEAYFQKVLSYSERSQASKIFTIMATDYLFQMSIIQKEMVKANMYWLTLKSEKPMLVYQPGILVPDTVSVEEIQGEKIQLTLSVDEAGYVKGITEEVGSTESHKKTFQLVKNVLLESRFSPVHNAEGLLIGSEIKIILQIAPDLKKSLSGIQEQLERTMHGFYPDAYRNRKVFTQYVYR